MLDTVVHRALEALPDDRSHGAAEKLKFECAGDDLKLVESPSQDDERIFFAGCLLRLREPVLVALAVAEFKRVLG